MTEKLREAARQALEALCRWSSGLDVDAVALNDLIDELDAALAEPEPVQEPVAWLDQDINAAYTAAEMDGDSTDGLVPLYTAPPQRPPLTAQEPVAWMTHENDLLPLFHRTRSGALAWGSEPQPLYTAPPQRPPLTDDEILALVKWHRYEMYLRLTSNPELIAEAKAETLQTVRRIERKVRGEKE